MGEFLECLEDLDLMLQRQGSTWHEGAIREVDDRVSGGLGGAMHNSQTILYRHLAYKDQVILY